MLIDPILMALERGLRGELPGDAAKLALTPRPAGGRLGRPRDPDARPAAVLVLLIPEHGALHLPLLRRRNVDGDVHGGQLALPGGGVDPGESIEAAALREANEELGIEPSEVHILGRLSPQWIPVSGYRVDPVVAWALPRPSLVADPSEVEHALWTTLDHLACTDPVVRTRERGAEVYEMPGWELPEGFLWGATAMILAELIALLPR